MAPEIVTDLNFEEEVLNSPIPVLVTFTATWCGPCRALAPLIGQLAVELEGKVKVVKVDINESPATSERYEVKGVPNIQVFKGGSRSAQHVGITTKKHLLELVGQ
jgi:thioredoxin 1